MEDILFSFLAKPLEKEELLPQLSRALEKRTHLLSREKMPGIWALTDRLNAVEKAPEAVLRRRRIRSRIWGVICLLLGIFLFVPGLMKPQELLGPLLMGAIAIGAGIGTFFRGRKRKKNPFDKAAARLLEQGKDSIFGSLPEFHFSSDDMRIITEGKEQDCVPYSDFEFVFETEDLFLLIYREKITALHKESISSGRIEDFRSFLQGKCRFHGA
ncbi:MAG: YcxB family protein [Bacillota bacterium]|nr:YcxB family protein [Bacillota bacterium]